MKRKITLLKGTLVGLSALALSACSLEQPTEEDANLITVSGKIGSGFSKPIASKTGGDPSAFAITDYTFYCVTFSEKPKAASSAFSSDGSFSVSLPADVPFGCFINDSTNMPIATVRVVDSENNGMANQSSDTLSLGANVDLGSLAIDLDKGEVAIPLAKIADAKSDNSEAALDLDMVHDQTFKMECIKSGNLVMDLACAAFVDENESSVYMRVLKATTNSGDIRGLGVWGSKDAFVNCGSIDMHNDTATTIVSEEGNGFTWTQNTPGVFENVGDECKTRGEAGPADVNKANGEEALDQYYVMDKLIPVGASWNLTSHSESSGACSQSYTTAITFSKGSKAGNMVGNFAISDRFWGDCGEDAENSSASFVVRFVKQ